MLNYSYSLGLFFIFHEKLERCEHLFQRLSGSDLRRHPAPTSSLCHSNLRHNTLTSFPVAGHPPLHEEEEEAGEEAAMSSYCLESVYLNASPTKSTQPTSSAWTSASKSATLSHGNKSNGAKTDVSKNSLKTPEALCSILVLHGLGDPRKVKLPYKDRRQMEYEERQLLSRKRFKRRDNMKNVEYYIEKLKGQALIDSYTANSKAGAFCEQQRDCSLPTLSANRQEQQHFEHIERAFSHVSSAVEREEIDGKNNESPRNTARMELFQRIVLWMGECERAMMEVSPAPTVQPESSNNLKYAKPSKEVTIINRDIEVKRKMMKNISLLPVI